MKAFDREERIERLLETKTFAELTEEERSFALKELGSEEQYAAMRRVTLALITSKADLSPDPDVLQSLQIKMKETRRTSSSGSVFAFNLPSYAVALLVALTAIVTWFVARIDNQEKLPAIVEVLKRDTVFVERVRMDTVYKTRVIYREINSDRTTDRNYFQVVRKEEDASEQKELGVSMKDKQELEMLLVSGSE